MIEQFHFWYLPKRSESRDLNRCLYTQAPNRIIHKSQKTVTAQMSTDSWMDKQNAV